MIKTSLQTPHAKKKGFKSKFSLLVSYRNHHTYVRVNHHMGQHMRFWYLFHMGLDARKTVFRLSEQQGADQHAHPGSLFSSFVICLLESIISRLGKNKILII